MYGAAIAMEPSKPGRVREGIAPSQAVAGSETPGSAQGLLEPLLGHVRDRLPPGGLVGGDAEVGELHARRTRL